MERIKEINGRAKLIIDVCKMIQEDSSKYILTTSQQVSAILQSVIMDAERIITLTTEENKQ